jgi:hypothetical protein
MEASASGYVISQERLLACFPCNLGGFSARRTFSLKAPEPTRKASNLSQDLAPREQLVVARDRVSFRYSGV